MKNFYLIALCIAFSSCASGGRGDRDGGPGSVNIDLGLGDVLDSVNRNNLSNACYTNFGVCQIAPFPVGSNCYCDAMTAVGPQRHFGQVR